ncbi:MAG: hypothetical protein FJZ64_00735 [Chlamydiae bacterium]|nr:hypothetical protein [Chlamydiota bacterium]
MNFTREPLIETVIMPREGCKLLVRNSKGGGKEEYFVDSIEVVSFGNSFFFRSQEKPKSFLVPVSDYEVLEQKETRLALRNAPMERSIKIGGGRQPQESFSEPDFDQPSDRPAPQGFSERDRKRDKRRRGRRGGMRDSLPQREMRPPYEEQRRMEEEISSQEMRLQESRESSLEGTPSLEPKAPSFISRLFPPPSTLIKETLSRYKPAEEETEEFIEKKEENLFEEPPFPTESSQNSDEDDSSLEE